MPNCELEISKIQHYYYCNAINALSRKPAQASFIFIVTSISRGKRKILQFNFFDWNNMLENYLMKRLKFINEENIFKETLTESIIFAQCKEVANLLVKQIFEFFQSRLNS